MNLKSCFNIKLRKKLTKRQILLFDSLFIIVLILLMWLFKSMFQWILIAAFFVVIISLWITGRTRHILDLIIALSISLIWNVTAKDQYGYNLGFVKIYGVTLMPLFAWTLGLFALYILYSHYQKQFKFKRFYKRFILFTIIYWSLLMMIETVAYHFVGIRNIATSNYEGLPICNCIHAPSWMKIAYFTLGWAYFLVIELFKRLLRSK